MDIFRLPGRDRIVTSRGSIAVDEFLGQLANSPEGRAMAERMLTDAEADLASRRGVEAAKIASARRRQSDAERTNAPKIEAAGKEVVRLRQQLATAEAVISRLVLDQHAIDQNAAGEIRVAEASLLATAPAMIDEFIARWRDFDNVQSRQKPHVEAHVPNQRRAKNLGFEAKATIRSNIPTFLARRAAVRCALADAEQLKLEPDPEVIRARLIELAAAIPYVDALDDTPMVTVDGEGTPLEQMPHELEQAAE